MDYSNSALIMFITVMASLTLMEIFSRNRCDENYSEIDDIKIALNKLEKRVDVKYFKKGVFYPNLEGSKAPSNSRYQTV